MPSFSVLITVYKYDDLNHFNSALKSILNQTLVPTQIVIVVDGPVGDALIVLLNYYKSTYNDVINIIYLENNVGLGNALREGLKYCDNEFVARMDADDISIASRFEKMYNYLIEHEDVDVVGTAVQEFHVKLGDLDSFRRLPCDREKIKKFARFRNPLNHPTIMFRKSQVIKAGSYLDMPLFEDYYLWARMLNRGFVITNLNESLLYFRIGNNMVGRRHGWKYLKKELKFLKAIRKDGFINNTQFMVSIVLKIPVRLLPLALLKTIYRLFLR